MLVLLLALTALTFAPTLNNGFTNWDDDKLVTNNDLVRSLSWENLRAIFGNFHLGHYNPLVLMSFALEFHFFGLNPFYYHLDNLLLHMLNVGLVYGLFLVLSRDRAVAFLTALLFAVHPLRVESVAWVTERKTLLSVPFQLGSLMAYCRWQTTRRRSAYVGSLALMFVSFFIKSMAITLPFLLLLLDYLRGRKFTQSVLLEKVPFFLLAVFFAIIAAVAQIAGKATETGQLFQIVLNTMVATHGIVFYLQKTLFPIHLSCLYPYPAHTAMAMPLIYKVSPFLVVALGAAVYATRRRTRVVLFGALFFLLTAAPVLQFMPAGMAVAADRYMYLPHLGLFYMVAYAVVLVYRRHADLRWLVATVTVAVVGWFCFLSFQYSQVWRDSVTLWTQALSTSEDSTSYSSRAQGYIVRGDFSSARKDLERSLQLEQSNPISLANMGIFYMKSEQYKTAADYFSRALKVNPQMDQVWINRSLVFGYVGQQSDALADAEEALRLAPMNSQAQHVKGEALRGLGRNKEAIEYYNRAIHINPYVADYFNGRGQAYAAMESGPQAENDYSQAIQLDPLLAEVYVNRGMLYLHSYNDANSAIKYFDAALKIKPDTAMAYNGRGAAFFGQQKFEDALRQYNEAIRLEPRTAGFYLNRALVHVMTYHDPEALQDLDKCLELAPDSPEVLLGRAAVLLRLGKKPQAEADLSKAEKLGAVAPEDLKRAVTSGQTSTSLTK